jgi:hypothetical protein
MQRLEKRGSKARLEKRVSKVKRKRQGLETYMQV